MALKATFLQSRRFDSDAVKATFLQRKIKYGGHKGWKKLHLYSRLQWQQRKATFLQSETV